MTKLKKILIVIGIIVGLNVLITAVNILQNGIGGWDKRTVDQILGVPAEKATPADIEKLSKSEVMQLFYAAPAPAFGTMKGEYKAKTISVGVMAASADYFTHHFFGPGHWEGKAFFPFEKDKGWGYNLFTVKNSDGTTRIARTRKMNNWVGTSTMDDRDSFHLDYSPYNGGLVKSMHDEVRKINDKLYICMGHMAAGGGAINPAPFILYGDTTPWVGPDKE